MSHLMMESKNAGEGTFMVSKTVVAGISPLMYDLTVHHVFSQHETGNQRIHTNKRRSSQCEESRWKPVSRADEFHSESESHFYIIFTFLKHFHSIIVSKHQLTRCKPLSLLLSINIVDLSAASSVIDHKVEETRKKIDAAITDSNVILSPAVVSSQLERTNMKR